MNNNMNNAYSSIVFGTPNVGIDWSTGNLHIEGKVFVPAESKYRSAGFGDGTDINTLAWSCDGEPVVIVITDYIELITYKGVQDEFRRGYEVNMQVLIAVVTSEVGLQRDDYECEEDGFPFYVPTESEEALAEVI